MRRCRSRRRIVLNLYEFLKQRSIVTEFYEVGFNAPSLVIDEHDCPSFTVGERYRKLGTLEAFCSITQNVCINLSGVTGQSREGEGGTITCQCLRRASGNKTSDLAEFGEIVDGDRPRICGMIRIRVVDDLSDDYSNH